MAHMPTNPQGSRTLDLYTTDRDPYEVYAGLGFRV